MIYGGNFLGEGQVAPNSTMHQFFVFFWEEFHHDESKHFRTAFTVANYGNLSSNDGVVRESPPLECLDHSGLVIIVNYPDLNMLLLGGGGRQRLEGT